MKSWEAALSHQAGLLQWQLLGEQGVLVQNDSNMEWSLGLL